MLYEDPVTGIDIEKQTATTISGKLLKYGTLIVATGCTATRYSQLFDIRSSYQFCLLWNIEVNLSILHGQ